MFTHVYTNSTIKIHGINTEYKEKEMKNNKKIEEN